MSDWIIGGIGALALIVLRYWIGSALVGKLIDLLAWPFRFAFGATQRQRDRDAERLQKVCDEAAEKQLADLARIQREGQ